MAIEEAVTARINELIRQAQHLSIGNNEGQARSERQMQECSGWLVSALNAIQQICESPRAAYRLRVERIFGEEHGWVVNQAVGEVAAILQNLLADAEAGLLASIADQARAETFDDFLDHADAYLAENRKNEAGVIAGVVFEDSVRRVCRTMDIPERGIKLDSLISELAARGELTAVKAKRARVAAHVRTKASHAQWDEFEPNDVAATIEFTRELIASKLD